MKIHALLFKLDWHNVFSLAWSSVLLRLIEYYGLPDNAEYERNVCIGKVEKSISVQWPQGSSLGPCVLMKKKFLFFKHLKMMCDALNRMRSYFEQDQWECGESGHHLFQSNWRWRSWRLTLRPNTRIHKEILSALHKFGQSHNCYCGCAGHCVSW